MIKVENLCFAYSDGNKAIDDISFEIKEGECVALMGRNGAGKSTLLNLLLGIELPKNGKISVDGIMLETKSIKTVREKIGMVFQNPDEQLFMTTPKEDIGFGPANMGKSAEEVKKTVEKTAKELGIAHLLERMFQKLSGGEKRLVAIATALVCDPKTVLFDEPLSFLDPMARSNVADIIKKLDKTRIIATHDMDMALGVCDRIIILKDGKKAADGGKEILYNEELLRECGLDLPISIKACRNCSKNK